MAQRTISGKVSNDQGEDLIGVTVTVPGTSSGASTDVDGNYRLSVPAGAAAQKFTYTGYETQEYVPRQLYDDQSDR